MPFTKLANSHSCKLPKTRDDGSTLVVGDEWTCDEMRNDDSGRRCAKRYQWRSEQRDGLFWMPITR